MNLSFNISKLQPPTSPYPYIHHHRIEKEFSFKEEAIKFHSELKEHWPEPQFHITISHIVTRRTTRRSTITPEQLQDL